MRTIQTIAAMRAYGRAAREDAKGIGLVPTMGAFHEGHLSLMRRARTECEVVVVSLFVNPTQFGPGEDYERYPRSLDHDSRLAQSVPVDALFVPDAAEMYPRGSQAAVELPILGERWEGAARPGHFRGVATVCAKLFNIVQPDRAYFGKKDYQQLKIIERMVADLAFPLVVVPVATVREEDGLAMSSRNRYLSPADRRAATVLSRALALVESRYREGERDGRALSDAMASTVAAEPAAVLDYAAIADGDSLEPLSTIGDSAVALIAARFGSARLIDNTLLGSSRARNHHIGQAAS